MNKIIVTVFVFLATVQLQASELKVLTWNVYMLPRPIKFSQQGPRTSLITEQLKKLDHDIIVLQEAFMCSFRTHVGKELKSIYPYQKTLDKSGHWKQVMNSGLMVLSRYPFKVLGSDFYDQCAGADCFSSKGVLLVQVNVPGKPVQLAVTHMQSGDEEAMRPIRKSQLVQVKKLLDKHAKKTIPQIFVGDLNIDALKPFEFFNTLEFLGVENSSLKGEIQSSKSQLTSCLGQANTRKVAWLDHVLLKNNESSISLLDKKVSPIQETMDGVLCDLSDHHPVEASFRL